MATNKKSFLLEAAPLLLVIFIDSMGLGLVFPILNALVFHPTSHFLPEALSGSTRNIIYGFIIGLFMFCWFFGAAFLGDLSDQIGRKKSLLICLGGSFIGYGFSALSIITGSFSLLIVGRVIAGFTAGSQSIAQAAIVDLSAPKQKARNLGLILFFSSIGFVFGPMIGGVLSDSQLSSYFNFAMPFYFAAGISLLNAVLLQYFFKETFMQTQKLSLKFHYAIQIFISAFKHDKIRELSFVLLVMIFGWSGIYSFISMYLFRVYQCTPLENGFFMALMGVGFGVGTGFLIEPLTKRFSLQQCVIISCLSVAFFTTLTITAPREIYVWFYVIGIGTMMAVAYSTLLTLFSDQVDENAQGWVMGITGAIMAFAFGINGFLTGIIANLAPSTPLIISIACLVLAAGMMKSLLKLKFSIPANDCK